MARVLASGLALAGLGLLLLGAFGSAHAQAAVGEGGPGCILRMTTGIECPFCGMTRATIAMGAGDFHRAFALHPLAPFVLLFAFTVLGIVAFGKTRTLLSGRRHLWVLGTVMAMWIIRLAV